MAIDFRIERRFENLKKGHRSEVQMSVMLKSDMDFRIGCRSEAGHRSESYIYNIYIAGVASYLYMINHKLICSLIG